MKYKIVWGIGVVTGVLAMAIGKWYTAIVIGGVSSAIVEWLLHKWERDDE